jgi:hypothetical protein
MSFEHGDIEGRRAYSEDELIALRVVDLLEWNRSGDPAVRGPAQYAGGDHWPRELWATANTLDLRAASYRLASKALAREIDSCDWTPPAPPLYEAGGEREAPPEFPDLDREEVRDQFGGREHLGSWMYTEDRVIEILKDWGATEALNRGQRENVRLAIERERAALARAEKAEAERDIEAEHARESEAAALRHYEALEAAKAALLHLPLPFDPGSTQCAQILDAALASPSSEEGKA